MMTDAHCGDCGLTAWPQMNLNASGKIKPACPRCGREHAGLEVSDFQQSSTPSAEPRSTPAPRVAAPTATPKTASAVPVVASFNVIDAVRDRMTYLGGEEARLEGVLADAKARLAGIRTEAKKLRRMLSAAERVDFDSTHHQHQ